MKRLVLTSLAALAAALAPGHLCAEPPAPESAAASSAPPPRLSVLMGVTGDWQRAAQADRVRRGTLLDGQSADADLLPAADPSTAFSVLTTAVRQVARDADARPASVRPAAAAEDAPAPLPDSARPADYNTSGFAPAAGESSLRAPTIFAADSLASPTRTRTAHESAADSLAAGGSAASTAARVQPNSRSAAPALFPDRGIAAGSRPAADRFQTSAPAARTSFETVTPQALAAPAAQVPAVSYSSGETAPARRGADRSFTAASSHLAAASGFVGPVASAGARALPAPISAPATAAPIAPAAAPITPAAPPILSFTTGNIIVERLNGTAGYGAGTAPGNLSTAVPVFLDQFQPTGFQSAPVPTTGVNGAQSIALPTTQVGNQLALTDSTTSNITGFITRTVDRQGILVTGYNAPVGTATVASTNSATTARTIGVVTAAGINTATGINNVSTAAIRGATALTPTSLAYNATFLNGTPVATVSKSLDGTVGAATTINGTNLRGIHIFGNSLFASAVTTGNVGVNLIGTGGTLPTGPTTLTLLPGTGAATSAYGIVLFDTNSQSYNNTGMDTLFVANQDNALGLQRYKFDGTTWNLDGSVLAGISGANGSGMRGLAGSYDAATGLATLFATTAESNSAESNRLVSFVNTLNVSGSGSFSAFDLLATAPAGSNFRGVELGPDGASPVPEPATWAGGALLLAGAGWTLRRRRAAAVRA